MKKLFPLIAVLLLVAAGTVAAINNLDFSSGFEPASYTFTHTDTQAQTETQTETQADSPVFSKTEVKTKVNAKESSGYTFRSQKLFDNHYIKHGAEFGDITQQQYLAGANALISSKTALTKYDEDGDLMFYDKNKNEFAVLSSDGYIRTYFRPDDGIDYWNRQ